MTHIPRDMVTQVPLVCKGRDFTKRAKLFQWYHYTLCMWPTSSWWTLPCVRFSVVLWGFVFASSLATFFFIILQHGTGPFQGNHSEQPRSWSYWACNEQSKNNTGKLKWREGQQWIDVHTIGKLVYLLTDSFTIFLHPSLRPKLLSQFFGSMTWLSLLKTNVRMKRSKLLLSVSHRTGFCSCVMLQSNKSWLFWLSFGALPWK